MKKILMILMITIGVSSVTFGQTKMATDSKVEAEIIALEKAGWEAWKNKDTSWIQKNGTDEVLYITSDGTSDRSQYNEFTLSCDIKSFSLADFKLVMLDKDAVLLTYTATQEGVCGGQKIPSQVRAAVNYVKRGGKWLEAMYMETAMSVSNGAINSEKPDYFYLRPEVEKAYGYTHAVKIGNDIKISGAVSMDDKGNPTAKGDLAQQMKNAYADLEKVLKHFGCTFDDVVVENVFTTDMPEFLKQSGYRNEIYKKQFPTGSWLGVKELALPEFMIEIELEVHKSK